jgi:exodeoxyribonuclease-3
MGLRIDHILVSAALAGSCKSCVIDIEPRRNERPSDHAPVIAEFAAG